MQLLGTLGGIGTIAVGVILFTSERSAEQRVEADRARQEVMQSYLGDMKELVLDKGLLLSELGSPERQFARTNTLTALRQLDGSQKGLLLQFLHGANLITVSVRVTQLLVCSMPT